MIRLGLCLTLRSGVARASEDEPLRFWKDTKGREIVGELVASDGVRVTLRIADNSKKVLPLTLLSVQDREFISEWRKEHPRAPWVDPEAMPAWPQEIGRGECEVKKMPFDASKAEYKWCSKHCDIRSDIELPLTVVRDMATIFETTRLAIQILPLGLAASPPGFMVSARDGKKYRMMSNNSKLLRVQLYGNNQLFARAGAPAGSGGFYSSIGNRTVLSLSNLGIKGAKGVSRKDYMKSAFVLKHEITHHLLHDWMVYLPIWFKEGFAEYMGAVPYNQGRLKFASIDLSLHKYLNKWRYNEDPNRIPIMQMKELMTRTPGEWSASLRTGTPILEYNSAAVLVHFFIHHDGKGNAAYLAAYLDAIRQGISPSQAEKTHLLRGRSYEQLDKEVRQVWERKKIALERPGEFDPFK